MPDGIPHRTIALAALAVVALAAALIGALYHESIALLVGLAVSVPILIVLLTQSARRHRNRAHRSS